MSIYFGIFSFILTKTMMLQEGKGERGKGRGEKGKVSILASHVMHMLLFLLL